MTLLTSHNSRAAYVLCVERKYNAPEVHKELQIQVPEVFGNIKRAKDAYCPRLANLPSAGATRFRERSEADYQSLLRTLTIAIEFGEASVIALVPHAPSNENPAGCAGYVFEKYELTTNQQSIDGLHQDVRETAANLQKDLRARLKPETWERLKTVGVLTEDDQLQIYAFTAFFDADENIKSLEKIELVGTI